MSSTWFERVRGRFIVFDGPDGAGKSTQLRRLAEELRGRKIDLVTCNDPGGTPIGDRIRSVLLDYDLSEMDIACETLLFMASRAQLVGKVIRPALSEGKTVLSDRFVTATCAYQGVAGYDPCKVVELARFAVGDCWPDLTILLDVDPDEGFDRTGRKPSHAGKRRKKSDQGQSLPFAEGNATPDAMDARSLDFHRKVRQMFREVHAYYPRPVITIDGRGEAEEVFSRIMAAIEKMPA